MMPASDTTNTDSLNQTPVESSENSSHPFYKDVFGMIVAGVVLLFFFWLSRHMLDLIGEDPKEWARATYIFSGIEAIAFAAAGYIFGREVNRKRAEQAETRAHTEAKAKGKSLVNMIQVKKQKQQAVLSKAPKAISASIMYENDIDELLTMGNKLFPNPTR